MENRALTHHGTAQAVMEALAVAQIPGWQSLYETPFNKLPFEIKWTDEELEEQEKHR